MYIHGWRERERNISVCVFEKNICSYYFGYIISIFSIFLTFLFILGSLRGINNIIFFFTEKIFVETSGKKKTFDRVKINS